MFECKYEKVHTKKPLILQSVFPLLIIEILFTKLSLHEVLPLRWIPVNVDIPFRWVMIRFRIGHGDY